MEVYRIEQVAKLASTRDNVAIALRRLEKGTGIRCHGSTMILDSTVLEGHRFALRPISAGEDLLSWGLPFGTATREIGPGSYICNQGMLEALNERQIDFDLPELANFENRIVRHELDEQSFRPAFQVPVQQQGGSFMGYRRGAGRGVGTRNFILLLGTSSLTGSFVKQLEKRLIGTCNALSGVDGVVALAHTEGGVADPNNRDLLLRTLAGFVVHPNVAAVLAVDQGTEAVSNEALRDYLAEHDCPLDDLPHSFLSVAAGFAESLDQGESIVRQWLESLGSTPRSEAPLSELKIALQCGGSDAFSGLSGNPLAAWVAREVIRHGGSANLAETDELIGAESYVLEKVRDLDTAKKFLATVERFKERAAWHGTTVEGNPSGGNKFRGLYNITLKSVGAAMKRHPDVRLDAVIDYAERMTEAGFYFMDSPGNDLESVAGQVASGANLIIFVTGNGSITNFPFVPTMKMVTTTRRFEMLSSEMDVNAGAYLDGAPMESLGMQTFEQTLALASGELSKGELAGHSQAQIWRNWQRSGPEQPSASADGRELSGDPLPVRAGSTVGDVQFELLTGPDGPVTEQLGLILPTSLCAGQVGRMMAERLEAAGIGRELGIHRYVSLVHTEGCGVAGAEAEAIFTRTLLGYLSHPLVGPALLLEHGCEKTHNDYMRNQLRRLGLDPEPFGWASIQLDGGIKEVMEKVERWFRQKLSGCEPFRKQLAGAGALRVGLVSAGPVAPSTAAAVASVFRTIVEAGGTVVAAANATVLAEPDFTRDVLGLESAPATLAYGQRAQRSGFQVMATPTAHWVETLTGLGATGVEIVLALVADHPMQLHPMIPILQVSAESAAASCYRTDMDLILVDDPQIAASELLALLARVASREYAPGPQSEGNEDFQMTRGLAGISV